MYALLDDVVRQAENPDIDQVHDMFELVTDDSNSIPMG